MAAAWESAHDEAERLAKAELAPLSANVDQRMKQWLLLLDREHGCEILDEEERATLSGFIFDRAIELLDQAHDPELEALCDRHGGEPPDDDDDDDVEDATGTEHGPGAAGTERANGTRAERRLGAVEQAKVAWASDSERIKEIVQTLFARIGAALEAAPAQDLLPRARATKEGGDLAGLLGVQFEAEQLGLAERLNEAAGRVRQVIERRTQVPGARGRRPGKRGRGSPFPR